MHQLADSDELREIGKAIYDLAYVDNLAYNNF